MTNNGNNAPSDLSEVLDTHAEWLATEGSQGARADLGGANLSKANLSGVNLSGANLIGASLIAATLSGANLGGGANLSGANLMAADLSGVNLIGANLRGVSLNGANLNGANLNGANLSGADLTGVNLNGADLNRADLIGTDLNRAHGVAVAGPVGTSARTIYAIDHGWRIMVHAGCWWGSVPQLRTRIAPGGGHGWNPDTEGRNRADYEAALGWLVHRIESAR